MAEKSKMAPQLPAASMAKKKTVDAYRPLPADQLVSEWALITSVIVFFTFSVGLAVGYALDLFHVACSKSALVLRCTELTAAQAVRVAALWGGMLLCATAQAAAAAPVLLLPRLLHRRIRRALAYVALAATVANHCMYACYCLVVAAADPGALFFRIVCSTAVFSFAAGDLFLSFLLGGDE